MFIRSLPRLIEVARQPLASLVESFFPEIAFPQHVVHSTLNEMNGTMTAVDDAMKALASLDQIGMPAMPAEHQTLLQRQLHLLFQRVVVHLQCGFAFAAEDDLNQFCDLFGKCCESQFDLLTNVKVSEKNVSMLRLIIALMLQDHTEAKGIYASMFNPIIVNGLQSIDASTSSSAVDEAIDLEDKAMSDANTSLILKNLFGHSEAEMHKLLHEIAKLSDGKKRLQHDHHMAMALCIVDIVSQYEANIDKTLSNPGIMDPLASLLIHYHLRQQIDEIHQACKLYAQANRSSDQADAEFERMQKAFSYWFQLLDTAEVLPMKYRGNEGDDRHPKTVLRTMLDIRQRETEKDGKALTSLVRVESDGQGDFRLVTKCAITAKTLMLAERPFICYPMTSLKTCAHCFKPISKSEACVRCVECQLPYCNKDCRDAAMHSGHYKLCLDSEGSSEWKAFESDLIQVNLQTTECHAILHSLQLMIKADCLGLSSALKLPEIKIMKHCTDLPDELSSIHPMLMPRSAGMELQACLQLRDFFLSFKQSCPSLFPRNARVCDFIVLYALLEKHLHLWKVSDVCYSGMFLNFVFANQDEMNRGKYDVSVKWIGPEHEEYAMELQVITNRDFAAKEQVKIPETWMI
jgi:hypothetical protein